MMDEPEPCLPAAIEIGEVRAPLSGCIVGIDNRLSVPTLDHVGKAVAVEI